MAEIEKIEINIQSSCAAAASSVDKLADSLRKLSTALKHATQGGEGFRKTFSAVSSLSKSLSKVSTVCIGKLGGWISESNNYIETLNFFTVAMGEYADEAKAYAEQVEEVMGIDQSQWMRNQGVFMTLATGLGVAGDRAALMSKNLTQLGYDLSSFLDIGYEEAMQKLQSGLSGDFEPLSRLGYDLSHTKLQAIAASLGIDKLVSSMNSAEETELVYYAIMTQVTAAQGDMARTLSAPANQLRIFISALTQAARAAGNIFIPALNAVLPYAIAFINVIRWVASEIATLLGFDAENWKVEWDGSSISGGADATTNSLKNATDAAKELQNAVIGFDELNVISPESGGGDISDPNKIGGGFDFDLPQYDFLGSAVNKKTKEIEENIMQSLADITSLVSGFSLALGAILLLTGGSIPLGLGLLAVGAIGLATQIVPIWSGIETQLSGALATITGAVGGFSLVLGVLLTFTGANIPLGIALMVIGAASLVSAVVINWNSMDSHVANTLSSISGVVGGATLALGALFALTGVGVALGIGLMLVGAAGIVSAVAVNWEALNKNVGESISSISAIVSSSFLGLGAILTLSGVAPALGIPMMAVGAASLATTVAVNWNSMSNELRDVLTTITTIVGAAALAIGAVLTFTGAATPLGIALMVTGAGSLTTAAALNWDSIKTKIQPVLSRLLSILSGSLIVLGAILCLSGAGVGLGLAVLAAGLAGSYTAWKLDDNPITRFVMKMANSIIGIAYTVIEAINDMFHINFGGLTLLGEEIIPAFNVRLVNIPKIPTLAEGGFPTRGQLFIANEAGPELVGSINGRTAVVSRRMRRRSS